MITLKIGKAICPVCDVKERFVERFVEQAESPPLNMPLKSLKSSAPEIICS